MPEAFPFFVGFPVEAVVEEVDGEEVGGVCGVGRVIERVNWWLRDAETVAAGVADRMRSKAGDVAVRGQRVSGALAGWGSCHRSVVIGQASIM